MLSGDAPANAEQKKFVGQAVYGPQHGLEEIRQFYETLTTNLVRRESYRFGEAYILDAVRE
jgi:hypothetical protein